ncbi:MAG: formyl transferase [Lachnospiraceae bacterium]|nr:formyl transferase [Lachnospiraceae bacterium]
MKIMLLSNNGNVKSLYEWLVEKGNDVTLYHDPITVEVVDEINPEIVISYNYQYIVKEDVINRLGDSIINMHTSYLPWNKGASPNIWSFRDDTPKGVTIHRLEKGLDTGKIIIQKELSFDENIETLSSTYSKLNEEIVKLLMNNWEMISSGNYTLKDQEGKGSYHRTSDLEAILKGKHIDYSMSIKEFKSFIAGCREE